MTHASSSTTRQEVYEAIDTEREYQQLIWSEHPNGGSGDNPLTIGEFILLIEEYASQARQKWAKENKVEILALNDIRKIAGIAVNCMEQHGAPKRNLATAQYQSEMKARTARYAEVKEKSKRK